MTRLWLPVLVIAACVRAERGAPHELPEKIPMASQQQCEKLVEHLERVNWRAQMAAPQLRSTYPRGMPLPDRQFRFDETERTDWATLGQERGANQFYARVDECMQSISQGTYDCLMAASNRNAVARCR